MNEKMKVSDNQKIYRGCVIGMTEILIDGLYSLKYDLESCPGIATIEEMEEIDGICNLLRKISNRCLDELKPYGLYIN